MRKLIVSALAAAALLSAPALAADIPVKGPIYKAAPVFNWTGFYGGVNAGYAWDPNYVFEVPPGTFDQNIPLNLQGGFGGLQIGYNWQLSRVWLVGVEADFQFANINDTFNFVYPGGGASFVTLAIKQFATLRGRLGYVQDRNLFYFTGGAAIANFKANADVDFDVDNGLINDNKWVAGYVVGLGFERAFASNWSLKFEYLYIDFAHLDIRGINTGGGLVALTGDPYMHLLRLGLNLRFSTGAP